MKWIEIITLRSLEKANRQIVDELLRQVFQQKGPEFPASIRVYDRPPLDTDLSIHIQWEAEGAHPCESPLGQRLAYALKDLGLLQHSLWVEAAAL